MKIPCFVLLSMLIAGCASPSPSASVPATPVIPAGTPNARGFLQAFIVAGNVTLIDNEGNATPLHRGQTFEEGNTIQVDAGAQALIVFSNGATLKALENCTVKVTLFRQAPYDKNAEGTFLRLSKDPSRSNTVLDLMKGTLQGEFKKPNKEAGSTFVVNTAKGPVDVSGVFGINGISATGETRQVDGVTKFTSSTKPATTAPTL